MIDSQWPIIAKCERCGQGRVDVLWGITQEFGWNVVTPVCANCCTHYPDVDLWLDFRPRFREVAQEMQANSKPEGEGAGHVPT